MSNAGAANVTRTGAGFSGTTNDRDRVVRNESPSRRVAAPPAAVTVPRLPAVPPSSAAAHGARSSGNRHGLGQTVTSKAALAVAPCSSVTVRVTVADPEYPAAGTRVIVRPAPVPPRSTPSRGSDDSAVTASRPAGVSASPTVNPSAAVV